MTMTIDDEIQLQPATNEDSAIVPEGRYTLHLVGLEKAPPSTFAPEDGPRVKWVFHLYAESGIENMARGEQFHFNNEPYEFWRTTSTKNSPRAYARKYAEALSGRKLEEKEVPKLSGLLDARMSAMITYEDDENDSSRKVLKMSGLKHVESPSKATAQKSAPPKAAPAADDATALTAARELLRKKIRQAEVLQSPQHVTWLSLNVDTMDLTDCAEFTNDVQKDIDAG